ncbi:MAG: VOC family protein [Clostridiaceae bacterium]
MNKLSPNLMVEDVKNSVELYKKLGFKISMAVPDENNPIWAAITNNEVEIMLQQRNSLEEEYEYLSGKNTGGTFTLFIETSNIDELYNICKTNEIRIIKDMHKTFYGTQEFAILDNDNYILVFSQK